MAEGMTAARVGSTKTPDTAELGKETLYIHVRCDPSSVHRTKTPRTYHAADKSSQLEIRAGEEVDVGLVWRVSIPLILGPSPLRNVLLPTVLSLLVNIVSAWLRIRPPVCEHALTFPPDIRALHPCPSSANGGIVCWGHIIRQLSASRILQQAIRGQEPTMTGNRPPVSIFLGWPTVVVGGHDLNLMISGPPVVPEAVSVCKLSGPPLIVPHDRRAKEPVQVHRVQGDGLLTPKLPLHAINMMKPDVHVKNNGNSRKPCLDLAHLIDPVGLYDASVECHVRGPHELKPTHGSRLHSQKFKLKQAKEPFLRPGIRTSSTPTQSNTFQKSSILRA
ncbi:hypothetical protein PIB30_098272 [Stylosanthes scabra]|uniref:Uncharacterized protein n=1 Tax=Stylosanthes scabra TaxID=79078 RepID=A0ABU6WZ36_9FABA|nr:hypothetical protein [Stylosanthes scabra]